MAIKFSGEFTSPRTPDEVYDFLSDPNKFAPLLPDFESMTLHDPTHFTVKVRVGVGNIRGTAEIKMELAEAQRPQRALYKGKGSAVGSQITVNAGFDLSPVDGATRIAWQGEAGVFGKLASMAGGMLEPLGKKNIQKLIDGLQWALTWPPAQVVAPEAPSEAAPGTPAGQPMGSVAETSPGAFSINVAAAQSANPAAEQPMQVAAQQVPSEVSQGLPASPSVEAAAEELHGAEAGATAQSMPDRAVEELHGAEAGATTESMPDRAVEELHGAGREPPPSRCLIGQLRNRMARRRGPPPSRCLIRQLRNCMVRRQEPPLSRCLIGQLRNCMLTPTPARRAKQK